ncbi:MAG: hypothetical protein PF487_00040 [Bacteroidales bacterium]|jgi:hypothetical protein|nr:hypothetical protein [Bacteroidales bacterium]
MLRKTPFLIALIAVVMIISGCKRIKHELDTVYSVEITANEMTLKTDGYLFGGSAVLDPNLNEDIKSFLEIVFVEIGEVSVTVKDANITDWLFAYSLEFKITNNITGKSITHNIVENVSLYPDNSYQIPDSAENKAFFTELLKNKHTATVEISGYSSQPGVILLFTLEIAAKVAMG